MLNFDEIFMDNNSLFYNAEFNLIMLNSFQHLKMEPSNLQHPDPEINSELYSHFSIIGATVLN